MVCHCIVFVSPLPMARAVVKEELCSCDNILFCLPLVVLAVSTQKARSYTA